VQIPVKWLASRRVSHDDPSNDSASGGDDQFIISPHPRRETRKLTHEGEESPSQTNEEAARITEGRAAAATQDAKARDEIQKVEHLLKSGFEYTMIKVDRHHPCTPMNFTLGENQSMVSYNANPFDWTTELHEQHFWNNFQADWYLTVTNEQKNPISPQLYVDWTYMQNKHDPVFNKVIAKAQSLGIFDILGMYQEWNTELVAQFYSTAWRSGNGYESTIHFSIEGYQFSVCVAEFPTIFGLAHDDFLRAEISIERTIMSWHLSNS
jgi:hypothetical protein